MTKSNLFVRWIVAIRDYFRFVNNRRQDVRFGVLPDWRLLTVMLFFCVTAILAMGYFADPDFLKWVRAGNAHTDGWFAYTTDIGKSNWMLVLTGSILVLMSIWRADRFRGRKYLVWHRVFLNVYFVFTTVAFSGLLALLFKNMIGRARPPFVEGMKVWQLSPFGDNYVFASFPSGHATTAGAISMALALMFPKFAVFVLPAGLWIAISRPVIGVHFPSDALAGLLFGVLFTWIYARSFARKRLLFKFDCSGRLKLRGETGRSNHSTTAHKK